MGAAFREVTLLPASPWLLCSLGGAPSPPLPVPPCLGAHCLCPPPLCLQPANRRCLTQKWSCEGPCPPLRSLAGCCRLSQHANPTSCAALRGGAPGAPAAEHRHHRTEKLRRLRRPGGHGRRELGSARRTASWEGGQTLAEAGTEVGGWGRGLSGWRGGDAACLRGSQSPHATVGPDGQCHPHAVSGQAPSAFPLMRLRSRRMRRCRRIPRALAGLAAAPGSRCHQASKPGPRAGRGGRGWALTAAAQQVGARLRGSQRARACTRAQSHPPRPRAHGHAPRSASLVIQ